MIATSVSHNDPNRKGIAHVVMKGSPAILVPARDYKAMKKRGWAIALDYIKVPGEHVVYRVDQDALKSTPVGLVSGPEAIKYLAKYLMNHPDNRLVRISDLVTLDDIAARTGRHKSTISGRWKGWPNWPKPITTFGTSDVWLWDDVVECLHARGHSVRPKERRTDGSR